MNKKTEKEIEILLKQIKVKYPKMYGSVNHSISIYGDNKYIYYSIMLANNGDWFLYKDKIQTPEEVLTELKNLL